MRKNSLKNTRINGEVQRVLAEIIRSDIKDPRILLGAAEQGSEDPSDDFGGLRFCGA